MIYQRSDWECYYYNIWHLPNVGYLRGPDPHPLQPGKFVAFLGTAHTFGRLAGEAYPQLLCENHEINVLDLSNSSVGPRYFINHKKIQEIVAQSAACVIQAPAARSCSNSRYHNHKFSNNVFQKVGDGPDGPLIHEDQLFPPLFNAGRANEAIEMLLEMRHSWVDEMITLLEMIKVPKILMWFSSRTPEYMDDRSSYARFCGEFPQLVNRQMFDQVAAKADATVEVFCRDGLPIRFVNRFVGEAGRCRFGRDIRSEQGYYPSQLMHDRAAEKLAPVVASLAPAAVAKGTPLPPHYALAKLTRQNVKIQGEAIGYAEVKIFYSIVLALDDAGAPRARGIAGVVGAKEIAILSVLCANNPGPFLYPTAPKPNRQAVDTLKDIAESLLDVPSKRTIAFRLPELVPAGALAEMLNGEEFGLVYFGGDVLNSIGEAGLEELISRLGQASLLVIEYPNSILADASRRRILVAGGMKPVLLTDKYFMFCGGALAPFIVRRLEAICNPEIDQTLITGVLSYDGVDVMALRTRTYCETSID